MSKIEFAYAQSNLEEVAGILAKEIADDNGVVSRMNRVASEVVSFSRGRKSYSNGARGTFAKEDTNNGSFFTNDADDIFADDFAERRVSRDLDTMRFTFMQKAVPLPTGRTVAVEQIPSSFSDFDDELRSLTLDVLGVTAYRRLQVDQRVVVNSEGGVAIQSVPFFTVGFRYGFNPIPISRTISGVVNTNADIANFTRLIRFLEDPTPDKRVRNAESFGEAFSRLLGIAPLKYGTLDDAGLEKTSLHDVVMLNGFPVHEIFGHHFEEPVTMLNFGESAAFRHDQRITRDDLSLIDNPREELEGYRLLGFAHFDAYGRERPEVVHVADGRVKGFLGGEFVDRSKLQQYLGVDESTVVGNSSTFLDGTIPQVRMSCSVLRGKTDDVDLTGKVLLVPNGGHTSPGDKTYAVNANEAYILDDQGEPRRILPLKVTGGIAQAMGNLVLLPDIVISEGMCQKAEPIHQRFMAGVPVSQACNAQLWRGQQVYSLPISEKHLRVLSKS